jgi:hypothetical protein
MITTAKDKVRAIIEMDSATYIATQRALNDAIRYQSGMRGDLPEYMVESNAYLLELAQQLLPSEEQIQAMISCS